MEKLAYRPDELMELLGIGRNAVYNLLKVEGFPVISVGRSLLIPAQSLERWLDQQTQDGRAVV